MADQGRVQSPCNDCLGRGVIVTGYPNPPLCLTCEGKGSLTAPAGTTT